MRLNETPQLLDRGLTPTARWGHAGGGPAPPPISVAEVTAARDAWIAAVQALDVEATTKLYDTDNVRLLGTVDTEDNKLRNNHGLIKEYFEHFLSNDAVRPVGLAAACRFCCLSVCLSIYLSIYLCKNMSIYIYICILYLSTSPSIL